jgi:hypothetical protein
VLNAGYYYTIVINRRIYAGAGVTPGIGVSYTMLTFNNPDGNIITTYFAPVYRFQERLGMGYNSRKIFAGVDVSMTQWIRNEQGGAVELNAARFYVQFFFGYRFRAPDFIRKNARVIEQKIPVLDHSEHK